MISVCLATYNGEKYIREQLDSIIQQIGPNDEIIISDDYSTDRTVQIINLINDKRIKIRYNPNEKGYSSNFENAIYNSVGDFIFISDQDDVWCNGKVEKMLGLLNKSSMVISDAIVVNEKLEVIDSSHFKKYNVKKGFRVNFMRTRYIGACMGFKREILKKALPFPSQHKYCAYDYWLAIVAEFYYNVDLINEGLILYRRHANNALNAGMKSTNPLHKRVITRLYCFIQLLIRYGK